MDERAMIARAAADALRRARGPRRGLEPHQIPPPGDWRGWLLLAGRGAGKTEACSAYVARHVAGPPCLSGPVPHWIGIIAPTLGDAATSCFYGPSGIRALDPGARLAGDGEVVDAIARYVGDATNFPVARLRDHGRRAELTRLVQGAGGLAVRWANGAEAKLFGASSPEDVERLRAGGNRCLVWAEELAAWRHLDDTWDQMRFGLRTGPRPHWIGSTTPKPRQLIRRLARGEIEGVVTTRATMWDNPHLDPGWRRELEETYGGKALGRQELYAEIIDQDESALWRRDELDRYRVSRLELPPVQKIAVGVDPSGGAGEQGIVVDATWTRVDRDERGRPRRLVDGYVLDDRSCRKSPAGWGREVVRAAVDHEADYIVVETNFGGDMAIAVVRTALDAVGINVPIRKVTASRGKRARAEPVAALGESGRWHMVGTYPELEEQMCTWTDEAGYSPDRMDAMVWPPHFLKLVGPTRQVVAQYGGAAMSTPLAR